MAQTEDLEGICAAVAVLLALDSSRAPSVAQLAVIQGSKHIHIKQIWGIVSGMGGWPKLVYVFF